MLLSLANNVNFCKLENILKIFNVNLLYLYNKQVILYSIGGIYVEKE